jgi:integrase/recombinase XerC
MDGTRSGSIDIGFAVEQAIDDLTESWVSSAQASRVVAILRSFTGFCVRGHGMRALSAVTPQVATAFVMAPAAGTSQPASVPLMHLRRLAVRMLFRSARRSNPDVGDPTLDLELAPRSQLTTRPLSDDEVTLCRAAAVWSLNDRRRGAAWALAEATCRTVELGQITVGDVDLANGRVWIHGGKTTTARWGSLTEWGQAQLQARLRAVPREASFPVVYRGQGAAEVGQVSGCIAVRDVLIRAGLGAEPGVRPASVAGWAGSSLRRDGLAIEEVARRLGMASLDRAARFIGWDWKAVAQP